MFAGMQDRVLRDKEEGDVSYFQALALKMEFIVKLVTAAIVACVEDDADRNRYSLEHKLVRANSLGEWTEALRAALVGPSAQFFGNPARGIVRELTERVGKGDWRYDVVTNLATAAEVLDLAAPVGSKAALRQAFDICVQIRNRTRGHGATTTERCHRLCLPISDALRSIEGNLAVFRLSWAYVRRNLSGKYLVIPLVGSSEPFEHLRMNSDTLRADGVYLHLEGHRFVPLVIYLEQTSDIAVPNGDFRDHGFELLSYITDELTRGEGGPWETPPTSLPPSETEGRSELEVLGNLLTNLPPKSIGHVPRHVLEGRLAEELRTTDRHPIVSLTGSGGIGKTTIAIAAIGEISADEEPPYDVVVWISARDIDLLESGPKPVAPKVVTQAEMARAAVDLIGRDRDDERGAEELLQEWLTSGADGVTLFVLDNFETVYGPADVFKWVDTYIRPPNKVLVTTRVRDFVGDYPIEVGGMNDEEAEALVRGHGVRLGITHLLTTDYKRVLVAEAEGHPYVMKILLGQVANEQRAVRPKRIIGSSGELLTALFERTFSVLTPAAQRVFLLLSSWRVFVPEVAVEAVALRPGSERFDVRGALGDLRRYSLVEHVTSEEETEEEEFVGVPLAAAIFGRRKLETSPYRMEVQEDRKLLMEFGPGGRQDVRAGIMPRVDRLIGAAKRASADGRGIDEMIPVLEYIARRVPRVYLRLAELVKDADGSVSSLARANEYLGRYLELAGAEEKVEIWSMRAELCELQGNAVDELHALAEVALATVSVEIMGRMANRINNKLQMLGEKKSGAFNSGLREMMVSVAERMQTRVQRLSATDCSRLAWLMLNLGDDERARDVAKRGLERDPENVYCKRLVARLEE